MSPRSHDHPVSPERVRAAQASVLTAGDAGRLAGLLGTLADSVRSRILFALAAAGDCASATWHWPWMPTRIRCHTR